MISPGADYFDPRGMVGRMDLCRGPINVATYLLQSTLVISRLKGPLNTLRYPYFDISDL